ncbi:MAG: hypothetical protein AAB552_01325 [Patescibacteria group bacterium]
MNLPSQEIISRIEKTIKDAGFLINPATLQKSNSDPTGVLRIDIFGSESSKMLPRPIVGCMTFDEKLWKILVCDGAYMVQIIDLHAKLTAELRKRFELRVHILITAPEAPLVSI